jgi:hypothetical protein
MVASSVLWMTTNNSIRVKAFSRSDFEGLTSCVASWFIITLIGFEFRVTLANGPEDCKRMVGRAGKFCDR